MPVIIEDVEMEVTDEGRETPVPTRPRTTMVKPDPNDLHAFLRRLEHRRDRLRAD